MAMAKSPEIKRTAWTVEEYLASEGYTLNELELALVKLYAQADFIEWEGVCLESGIAGKRCTTSTRA
jgi:hypothetical protein